MPEQHCASDEHAWLAALQEESHVPPTQDRPLQHCVEEVHASAKLRQAVGVTHLPALQVRPPQQSEISEHEPPFPEHVVPTGRHSSDWHAYPAQQSLLLKQNSVDPPHASVEQTPPEQIFPPQHCDVVVQVCPVPTHAGAHDPVVHPQLLPEHTPSVEPLEVPERQLPPHQPQLSRPAQAVQLVAVEQGSPPDPPVPASLAEARQRPDWHDNEEQQSASAVHATSLLPHDARQ